MNKPKVRKMPHKKEIYHIRKTYSASSLCGLITANIVSSAKPESLAKLEKGFNGFARYCHKCRELAGLNSEAVQLTSAKVIR